MKIKLAFVCIALLYGVIAMGQATTVYTCKGGAVAANTFSEFSQAQIAAANDYTMSQYGYLGITFLANSSNRYNCHSYAWHLREGNAAWVWINNALPNQTNGCYPQTHNIDKYWTDGCFIRVCNESDADKVHYYCGDHSAVRSTTHPGYYESKWGQLAVVRHTRTGVPYTDPVNSVSYYASTKISGAVTPFCSGTRTFSVKNITGATYTWTTSSGLSIVGANNQSNVTVQRTGTAYGINWVQVQIATPCSGTTATQKVNFLAGPLPVSSLSIYGVSDNQLVCPNVPISLAVTYTDNRYRCGLFPGAIEDVEWYTSVSGAMINDNSGMGVCPAEHNNAGVTITFPSLGYSYTAYVKARVYNTCGWSNWFPSPMLRVRVSATTSNCGSGGGGVFLRVAPNPGTSTVSVEATESFTFTQIRIYDKLGMVRKQFFYPKGTRKATLNVSELSTDIYQVQAFDGKEWKSVAFSKQ